MFSPYWNFSKGSKFLKIKFSNLTTFIQVQSKNFYGDELFDELRPIFPKRITHAFNLFFAAFKYFLLQKKLFIYLFYLFIFTSNFQIQKIFTSKCFFLGFSFFISFNFLTFKYFPHFGMSFCFLSYFVYLHFKFIFFFF